MDTWFIRTTNFKELPMTKPMLTLLTSLTACVLTLAAWAGVCDAQNGTLAEGHIALAAPMSGIVIDGDLSDWPEDTPRLPMRNHFQAYGPTDLEGVDLDTSTDFNPHMMVGFNDEEDVLYVAVTVQDVEFYMAGNEHRRDGIEIYVSKLTGGRTVASICHPQIEM
jgi:hypothetical protein